MWARGSGDMAILTQQPYWNSFGTLIIMRVFGIY